MSGPTAPHGVMPGAEPFAFPGGSGPEGRIGVLLVHGFTGNPMSMRPWGEHLAAEALDRSIGTWPAPEKKARCRKPFTPLPVKYSALARKVTRRCSWSGM